MNNSGTAIKELIDYFKIDAKDVLFFMMIWILILENKSEVWVAAQDNGIESIDKFIGKDYSRVRIGMDIRNKKKS